MTKEKIIQYRPINRKRRIKCGRWTWSTTCPAHLPMTLQRLGHKIDIIEGFEVIKSKIK